MWAGWIGNVEEKLAGGGIDHHYSDCQEGVNGGQGSVRVRNQDGKLTEQRDWHGHVHLHVGALPD